MLQSQSLVSKRPARVEALVARHAALEKKIQQEYRSYTSDTLVRKLKQEKLRIKEEIEKIRVGSV